MQHSASLAAAGAITHRLGLGAPLLASSAPAPLDQFGYADVSLASDLHETQLHESHAVLMDLSEDSLLKPFRQMAGQPAPGDDLGGWYHYDPDYNPDTVTYGFAPGATFGQWVSALARGYAITGSAATREKVLRLNRLYAQTISPDFYAKNRFPAYCYDKLVCGLIDSHQFAADPDAFAILERIAGAESAQQEIFAITGTVHDERQSWRGLLKPGVRRAIAVSAFLAVLIHFSGVNTIVDYAPAIFQSAGWNIDGALISTFLVGVTEFAFTLVAFWVIDRYGRKPLYIVGSTGMALTLTCLLVAVAAGQFHGELVLVLILTYLAFFAACVGPVFWTLVPEIFPNNVRGLAMIVPVLLQWVANAIVVLVFPFAFHQIGKVVTFGFLAVMALSQAIFTWRFVPETRNKTLEEIEDFWVAESLRQKEGP